MIITCYKKLEASKIYNQDSFDNAPFTYLGQDYNDYQFLVIRECTKKEYRDYLNKEYPPELANDIMDWDYFYEVSID
jgi:hypothetical protein